jgi:hypothetical protein
MAERTPQATKFRHPGAGRDLSKVSQNSERAKRRHARLAAPWTGPGLRRDDERGVAVIVGGER